MRVYVSGDKRWRVEVRDDGWVYVYERTARCGRYRSLHDAAEYLVSRGVTPDALAED